MKQSGKLQGRYHIHQRFYAHHLLISVYKSIPFFIAGIKSVSYIK